MAFGHPLSHPYRTPDESPPGPRWGVTWSRKLFVRLFRKRAMCWRCGLRVRAERYSDGDRMCHKCQSRMLGELIGVLFPFQFPEESIAAACPLPSIPVPTLSELPELQVPEAPIGPTCEIAKKTSL